jgi:sulfite exporter TauE/SafE
MGIGTSLFLIAVGAILDFAVSATTRGVNLHTVGLVLMIVGVFGALLSLMFWSSWGGFGGRREVVVDGSRRRRIYDEESI